MMGSGTQKKIIKKKWRKEVRKGRLTLCRLRARQTVVTSVLRSENKTHDEEKGRCKAVKEFFSKKLLPPTENIFFPKQSLCSFIVSSVDLSERNNAPSKFPKALQKKSCFKTEKNAERKIKRQ